MPSARQFSTGVGRRSRPPDVRASWTRTPGRPGSPNRQRVAPLGPRTRTGSKHFCASSSRQTTKESRPIARASAARVASARVLTPGVSRAQRPGAARVKGQATQEALAFHHHKELAYTVRVDKPNPGFGRMLQQAIGGPEGEMRVMNQYLFQAWGARGDTKYRDMLLHTGTEEIGHIEVLATAVAMNLDGMPSEKIDDVVTNPLVAARMGGVEPRHFLSAGLAAMPADANGVPFNAACIDVGGNMTANMRANVAAEAIGRTLAARLRELTDDPGMKDMLSFLIARDTMHQQQWLPAIEELGTANQAVPVGRDRRGRLQAVRLLVLRPRRGADEPRRALADRPV